MLKNKSHVIVLIITITAIFVIGLIFLLNLKPNINRNTKLEDIVIEEDKINIYVFWGEGCPHCEDLFNFFESIDRRYGKYYNIYGFEIWKNEQNETFMNQLLNELNDINNNKSVPTFIIGNKVFNGYKKSDNQKIKDAIMEQYNNRENNLNFENIINETK